MKKTLIKFAIAAVLVAPLAAALPAMAATPSWNVTGTWLATHEFGGNTYIHTNNITQAPDGTLTGTGGWDGTQNGVPISTPNTWSITSGSYVSGDAIHFNYHYTSVELCATDGYVDAAINPDGSMTGTWHDNCNAGRTGTWTTIAGTAKAINVTTNPAADITSTDATLNGTNGSVAAEGSSFWVSLAPFSTASPSIPSGVFSTPVLGSVAANTAFSAPLSLITTNGVYSDMPAVTPGTTYYYAAWSEIGGIWYPGAVLTFTTQAAPNVITNPATNITPTSATINGTVGGADADYTSFWLGTTPISDPSPSVSPTLPAGWSHTDFPGTYPANTPFSQNLTGLAPGTQYYFVAWARTVGTGNTWYPGVVLSFTTQAATNTITDPATNITPTSATINGTVGGADADYTSFWLGTTPISDPSPSVSPTLPAGWSHTDFPGTYPANTPFSQNLTGLAPGTQYYFVAWARTVGTGNTWYPGVVLSFTTINTGTLIVNKNTIGGDGMFNFTGVSDGFSITTNGGTGSQTLSNLTPGSYSISEVAATGWNLTSNTCTGVSVAAGQTASCVITNTKQASISGMKYNDLNRNGTKDTNEPGLSGWVIRLISDNDSSANADTVVATAITDANGNYSFQNVAPGTYEVRETHKNGWKRMSKNPKEIVITAGSVVTGVNFGNAVKKKGEKEDTDKDDNHNDQPGYYYANHGASNYDKDQNSKGHQQGENGNNGNNNSHR